MTELLDSRSTRSGRPPAEAVSVHPPAEGAADEARPADAEAVEDVAASEADEEQPCQATPESDEAGFQHTLAGPATVRGRGLFHGDLVTCTILPAPPDHGIIFERIDLAELVQIPATIASVTPRNRRTTLKAGEVTIETVEHCLSALAGLAIDNALIRLDGPELPCGDGSAQPYVDALLKAGIVRQEAQRRYCRITEPITVEEGDALIAALPAERDDLQILYDLNYPDEPRIPRQLHAFQLSPEAYVREIAPARTFSLREEAKALWDRGMCQHLTPRDVLVIGDDGPIDNAYRFQNEPVRHKVLDVIGDIYLLGRPIQGRIVAYRSGHSLNHQLVYRLVEKMRAEQGLQANLQRQMDVRAIMKIMRHRYPMLMIDRVVEIHGDQRAIGIKNVTVNEPFFQGHYPGTPIMPGVMIVEAMAQLSGLLLSRVLEHRGKIAVLLSLDKVKLRRPVVPGDQLVIEAEAIRAQSRTANVKCRALVAGQLAAEAQIKFVMVDAEDEAN
ncbi:MAG: UDP-3-O-[3-hydroxymyristoyl] N-acetylglucosamine deacetylase [Phycisphaerales bacterium]|nr:UDP-3-O-[3-hydroxymyristoyl] N-acetylglucosamine deacetylase [Phycisphaerales bacterium]